MLMLAIDLGRIRVGLVIGPAADTDASLRRLVQIEAASGAGCSITIFAPAPDLRLAGRAGDRLTRRLPTGDDLAGMGILFVSGLDEVSATAVADAARAAGALVNVEDRTGLCDFHMPALVQRGDLQIAIATGGRSPGLARGIRRYLEELFPSDWSARLEELAERRRQWRARGADRAAISRWTDALVDRRGWLR